MDRQLSDKLKKWAETYNDPQYFKEDPIAFPTRFRDEWLKGRADKKDIEISAIFSAHFAWGRRPMIVRDCQRLFDYMDWKPYDYVMRGQWRDDAQSIHRTIKWSEVALICASLKKYYENNDSLEKLQVQKIRTDIFHSKADPKAPDKKINMMRRWMVRRDGKVDLGIWKDSDPAELVIPLDVHVYDEAINLGLTSRKSKDLTTALEITDSFREIFPGDPCKGDFALFGYGIYKDA